MSTTTVTLTVGGVERLWTITSSGGAALSISGTPGAATVGAAYSFTPAASGGTPGYTFAVVAGTLPDGLSINGSTGAVTGTPTTAGTSSGITIRVTDSLGATADLSGLSIDVSAAAMVAWDATVNNPTGAANTVYTNDNRTASTSANTIAVRTVRNPVASGQTAGNWYAAVQFAGATTAGRSFGLILQSPPPGGGTLGTNRWSWGGTSIGSNSAARTMPHNITTDNGPFEMCVRVTENLFWMRKMGVGANWNNDPAADPVAGTGGLSCSARGTNPIFVMGSLPNTTGAASITLISGSPPSGFPYWS